MVIQILLNNHPIGLNRYRETPYPSDKDIKDDEVDKESPSRINPRIPKKITSRSTMNIADKESSPKDEVPFLNIQVMKIF